MSSPDDTAHHCRKFALFEDGFNCHSKECVQFRCWVTFEESHVAGWYHSPITQGPDPKLICTGATIHSLAITYGKLASHKLHVRVFSRKSDKDLGRKTDHTIGVQKWVNLFSLMLEDFKGNGQCTMMDMHDDGQRLHGQHHGNDRCLGGNYG